MTFAAPSTDGYSPLSLVLTIWKSPYNPGPTRYFFNLLFFNLSHFASPISDVLAWIWYFLIDRFRSSISGKTITKVSLPHYTREAGDSGCQTVSQHHSVKVLSAGLSSFSCSQTITFCQDTLKAWEHPFSATILSFSDYYDICQKEISWIHYPIHIR